MNSKIFCCLAVSAGWSGEGEKLGGDIGVASRRVGEGGLVLVSYSAFGTFVQS